MERVINKLNRKPSTPSFFENELFRKILKFFVAFILPFIWILLAALLKGFVDRYVLINSFLYFNILVLIQAWIGGFASGIFTAVLSTIVIYTFYRDPTQATTLDQFLTLVFVFVLWVAIVIIVNRLNKSRLAMKTVKDNIDSERRKMQSIIDSLFTFVVVVTSSGKIIEANKATVAISNTKQNITGKNVSDLYPWSYSVEIQHELSEAVKKASKGNLVNYDSKMRLNENQVIDVYISINPILNIRDQVDYMILSATDITDRKEYERELERVHQNYIKLLDSNIIGMVIADKDGNLLEMNDAFLNVIEHSRREIKDQNIKWLDIVNPEFKEKESADLEQILEKGYAQPVEKEFVNRKKELMPAIVSGVLINEDEGLILYIIVDITERKKLEQKKDEFVSIASHELKTPLTTLKGYVQLLGAKLQARNAENMMYMSRMDNQLIKITDLINDLLDISRIQSGGMSLTLSEFDMSELVSEMIQDVLPLSGEHKINLTKPDSPQIVLGDRVRIGQVIINFLSNAINYSPNSNSIEVFVQDLGGEVRVAVEDSGVGIPADKLDKLFQKFYRVEENQANWQQGLGLGLYISSEIVKKHNGKINVESEFGKGSIFYFDLGKVNGK